MPELSLIQAIIVYLLQPVLGLLSLLVFVSIIMSWLINFNVINTSNQLVSLVWRMSTAVTEPFLGPIRKVLPTLGGMDFSPIVLLLLIRFTESYLLGQLFRMF
jgi:YggT family protein